MGALFYDDISGDYFTREEVDPCPQGLCVYTRGGIVAVRRVGFTARLGQWTLAVDLRRWRVRLHALGFIV